jgi:hypothetical protein
VNQISLYADIESRGDIHPDGLYGHTSSPDIATVSSTGLLKIPGSISEQNRDPKAVFHDNGGRILAFSRKTFYPAVEFPAISPE